MSFSAPPIFPGLLNDSALRLAESMADPPRDRTGGVDAWQAARAMGWASVLVADEDGGSGGGLADLAAIVEGLTRSGTSLPIIERFAVAPILLAAATDSVEAASLRRALAVGEADVAVLAPHAARCWGAPAPVQARRQPDGLWRLAGPSLQADARAASHVLVVVDDLLHNGSLRSCLCSLDAALLRPYARRLVGVDGALVHHLELDALPPLDMQVLAHGEGVEQAAKNAEAVAALLTCVDTLSAVAALLESSIEHLNTRVQFSVALASFQVLRHKVVDIYVMYEVGRGLVEQCLRRAEADLPGALREIALCKLYLGQLSRFAGESVVQLHGAIGMSDELPAARLVKRILTNDHRYGDRLRHSAALSRTLQAHIASVW